MRLITNLVILTIELAMIAGLAWLAYRHAMIFAGLTAGLTLVVGWSLEYSRLRHEFPYYAATSRATTRLHAAIFAMVASVETVIKAALAGCAALLTFSGQDQGRLTLLAIVLAGIIFLGTSFLRRLSRSFAVRPSRWGYFRLAVPLGVGFSLAIQTLAGVGLVETKSLTQLANTIVFELPQKPSLNQISEFLFNIKQALDALVRTFLNQLLPAPYATIVGVIVSVNVLGGLIVAIYAVVIAETVRFLEDRWHGTR
jgi:hypothetical protein